MALTFIMKLLFLHGSPATGKLTVAKALLRMVPGRLMDNHASIDFARQIFDFDAPGFWQQVHNIRYSAMDAAASNGVALLVTTFCYAEPEDRQQFGRFEAAQFLEVPIGRTHRRRDSSARRESVRAVKPFAP